MLGVTVCDWVEEEADMLNALDHLSWTRRIMETMGRGSLLITVSKLSEAKPHTCLHLKVLFNTSHIASFTQPGPIPRMGDFLKGVRIYFQKSWHTLYWSGKLSGQGVFCPRDSKSCKPLLFLLFPSLSPCPFSPGAKIDGQLHLSV